MQKTLASYEQVAIRLFRRNSAGLLALVTFLTCLMLGPSKANATCGDYLAHHSHHQVVDHWALENPVERDSITPQVPNRLPCRGPSCQRGPVELPLSTPIVAVDLQDHWVWFESCLINAPQQFSYMFHANESVVLPRIAFRLDRPPKA